MVIGARRSRLRPRARAIRTRVITYEELSITPENETLLSMTVEHPRASVDTGRPPHTERAELGSAPGCRAKAATRQLGRDRVRGAAGQGRARDALLDKDSFVCTFVL